MRYSSCPKRTLLAGIRVGGRGGGTDASSSSSPNFLFFLTGPPSIGGLAEVTRGGASCIDEKSSSSENASDYKRHLLTIWNF